MSNFIKLTNMAQLGKLKKRVKFIAGGTDVFVLLSDGQLTDEIFCDISSLKDFDKIEAKKNFIHIGAGATFSKIVESTILKKYANCLVEAAETIGSPQIRNMATIGGNVANASPSGDSIPPLFVLAAKIKTNKRIIDIDKFFKGVKKNILKKNELITEILIPKKKAFSFFYKIGPRKAMAISKVSAAAAAALEKRNGRVIWARIAFGAVAPTVIRALSAERTLAGKPLTDGVIECARRRAIEEISPIDDFRSTAAYRKEVAGVILRRILQKFKSVGRAGNEIFFVK